MKYKRYEIHISAVEFVGSIKPHHMGIQCFTRLYKIINGNEVGSYISGFGSRTGNSWERLVLGWVDRLNPLRNKELEKYE